MSLAICTNDVMKAGNDSQSLKHITRHSLSILLLFLDTAGEGGGSEGQKGGGGVCVWEGGGGGGGRGGYGTGPHIKKRRRHKQTNKEKAVFMYKILTEKTSKAWRWEYVHIF